MDKPTLVLDKSFVKAAPKGLLAQLRDRFEFLLPDTLLHEIATERLPARQDLSSGELVRLDGMIQAAFLRATDEAGNQWIDNGTALGWEIERGLSARLAPKFPVPRQQLPQLLTNSFRQECFDYENPIAGLAAVVHSKEDQPELDRIRHMSRDQFLVDTQADFSRSEVRRKVAVEAKDLFLGKGEELGLKASSSFDPRPDWFCFGIWYAWRVYITWKLWRYGDAAPEPEKPANPWFDMEYVGYMAIADGIISMDAKLLELGWITWPEKSSHIYAYEPVAKQLAAYDPWK